MVTDKINMVTISNRITGLACNWYLKFRHGDGRLSGRMPSTAIAGLRVSKQGMEKGFLNTRLFKNPLKIDLLDSYIDRSRSFLSVLHIKSDPVTLIQRFKACCVDAGMMHEYVRSLLLLDESVPLCIIKPLYDPICHCDSLLTFSE